MPFNPARQREAQAMADEFNRRCPVGTPVILHRYGKLVRTQISGAATVAFTVPMVRCLAVPGVWRLDEITVVDGQEQPC